MGEYPSVPSNRFFFTSRYLRRFASFWIMITVSASWVAFAEPKKLEMDSFELSSSFRGCTTSVTCTLGWVVFGWVVFDDSKSNGIISIRGKNVKFWQIRNVRGTVGHRFNPSRRVGLSTLLCSDLACCTYIVLCCKLAEFFYGNVLHFKLIPGALLRMPSDHKLHIILRRFL